MVIDCQPLFALHCLMFALFLFTEAKSVGSKGSKSKSSSSKGSYGSSKSVGSNTGSTYNTQNTKVGSNIGSTYNTQNTKMSSVKSKSFGKSAAKTAAKVATAVIAYKAAKKGMKYATFGGGRFFPKPYRRRSMFLPVFVPVGRYRSRQYYNRDYNERKSKSNVFNYTRIQS